MTYTVSKTLYATALGTQSNLVTWPETNPKGGATDDQKKQSHMIYEEQNKTYELRLYEECLQRNMPSCGGLEDEFFFPYIRNFIIPIDFNVFRRD